MTCLKDGTEEDFPGGPVVKTSPSSAADSGSIPGQGTKIAPHPVEQLSPWATLESECSRAERKCTHHNKTQCSKRDASDREQPDETGHTGTLFAC